MSDSYKNDSNGRKKHWAIWEILALLLLIGSVVATASAPLLDSFLVGVKPNEVLIRMYAEEAGGFEPSGIVLIQGVTVRLVLMSMDVTHSLVIPDFDFDSGPVHAGYRKVIEFTPDKVGTFMFYCNTICSSMHPFMNGVLDVIQG